MSCVLSILHRSIILIRLYLPLISMVLFGPKHNSSMQPIKTIYLPDHTARPNGPPLKRGLGQHYLPYQLTASIRHVFILHLGLDSIDKQRYDAGWDAVKHFQCLFATSTMELFFLPLKKYHCSIDLQDNK